MLNNKHENGLLQFINNVNDVDKFKMDVFYFLSMHILFIIHVLYYYINDGGPNIIQI